MNQKIFRCCASLLTQGAAVSLLLAAHAAHAASGAWNVDSAGGWATDANWSPAAAPGTTAGTTNPDIATFSKSLSADTLVTVDANRNIGGITFSNGSAFKYVLGGGNLLLTNGGVIRTAAGNGVHTDTISTPIAIQGDGGTATFTAGATSASSLLSIADVTGVATGANVTTLTLNGTNTGGNSVTGVIADGLAGGKLAVIKSDAGTWILNGTTANSYSGGTSVIGGTLLLQKSAGGNAIAGNITLGDGAGSDILQLQAGDQIADDSVITLVGTLTNQRGLLRLNGFNETIGGLSSASTGAGVVENFSGTTNSILTLNVASGTQTYSGIVRNFGAGGPNSLALVKSGAGTQVLSGANSYTGTTTVNAGTLVIAGAQTGSGQIVLYNAGSVLQFGDGTSTSGSAANVGTVYVNSTGRINLFKTDGGGFANAIASNPTASITLSGTNAAGTTNTFSGAEWSNGGTISTLSTNAGAVLQFSNPNAIDIKGTTFTVDGAGDTLFTGAIYNSTGSGIVVKNGTGTLIYQFANTYGGETDINEGAIRVDVAPTAGTVYYLGNGGTTATAASLLLGGGSAGLSGGVTFNRNVIVNNGNGTNRIVGGTNTAGTNTFSGTVAMDGSFGENRSLNLTAAAGGTVVFTNTISGAGQGITKAGAGTVILAGVNTYSGNTTVSTGTLAMASTGSIANSPIISVAGGATFDVSALSGGYVLGASQSLILANAGAAVIGSMNCAAGTLSLASDGVNPAFLIPAGGMTISAGTVIKITSSATLTPGNYKILAKAPGGSGSVSGTAPATATVIQGGKTVTYTLTLSGGELYVTVPPWDHSLVVMGSSVAQGYGSSSSLTVPPTRINGSDVTGYAGLLQSLLMPEGWQMNNISIGGHNTRNALDRYATDLAPLAPTAKFAWFGYSMANEGLHGSANPAAIQATFSANLADLIAQSRASGFYPLVGLNYPRNQYTAGEYEYVKSMNLVMNSWDVPSANFLGAIDDGHGQYINGYFTNDTHPNDAGYQELFHTIVPTVFAAINSGKTASPQLAAANRFARLTLNPGVLEPVTFSPAHTMHPFTVAFRVRTIHDGTVAAVRSGANHRTLEIRGGQLVYRSADGREIVSVVTMANGGWHDVALAYRHALQQTTLMVDGVVAGTMTEQFVPDHFILGGPSASGRPATPAVVDFKNWCVYRSAWNPDEAIAQMQGNRQQASMEICAALDEAGFTAGSPATNRAQSLSLAMVNTTTLAAAEEVAAPDNLAALALPGSAAGLTWTRHSTTESGFVIERRVTGSSDWSDLVILPAGTTSYTNTGLTIGVSYDYRVAALDAGARGAYSNTASVVTGLGVHQTILVDFGPNDGTNGAATASPDPFGQYWNNFVGTGGGGVLSALSLANLITTTNAATTIGLNSSAGSWACNGFLNGGLLAPSATLLGNFAVANATGDYFHTATTASLTLSNLDPAARYRLRLFGTRAIAESRVTRYTVTGGNGPFTSDLVTSGTGIGAGGYNGNNNTIASISGVAPNAGNQIQVDVTRMTGAFAHLGIMEIMANHPPVAQALTYGAAVGQVLDVDIINGPDAPTDADGDGLVVTAVSGGAATNGGSGFTFSAATAGSHQFTYTVVDPYGGTATNTVTVTVHSTYASWANANGIAGAAAGDDNDKDGIPNLVEYAIGGNPGAFTHAAALVPAGQDYTLTCPKGVDAAADPMIDFAFEVSDDLVDWTEVAPTAEDASSVSYTLSGTATTGFVRLKIKQLQAVAP